MIIAISQINDEIRIPSKSKLINKKIKIIEKKHPNELKDLTYEGDNIFSKIKFKDKIQYDKKINNKLNHKLKKKKTAFTEIGQLENQNFSKLKHELKNKLDMVNPNDYNSRLKRVNKKLYHEDFQEIKLAGSKLKTSKNQKFKLHNIETNKNNFNNTFHLGKNEAKELPQKIESFNDIINAPFFSTQYNQTTNSNILLCSPIKQHNYIRVLKSLQKLSYPKQQINNRISIILEAEKLIIKLQQRFRKYLSYKNSKNNKKIVSNISFKGSESPLRYKFNIVDDDGTSIPIFQGDEPSNSNNLQKNRQKENFFTFSMSRQNSKLELKSFESFQLDNAENKKLKPVEKLNNFDSSFGKSDISIVSLHTSSIDESSISQIGD